MTATARRHATKLVMVVASPLVFSVFTAGSADATSVPLAGTAYHSKTYYSTPRYKTVTGMAGTTGVTYSNPGDYCGGGGLRTGFRDTQAFSGEVTNFPYNPGSVMYINIRQSPQYAQTFVAGAYWMTAQYIGGELSTCAVNWSGTLNW